MNKLKFEKVLTIQFQLSLNLLPCDGEFCTELIQPRPVTYRGLTKTQPEDTGHKQEQVSKDKIMEEERKNEDTFPAQHSCPVVQEESAVVLERFQCLSFYLYTDYF